MPEPTKGPIPVLDTINATLGQVVPLVTAGVMAYKVLWAAFKRDNPDGTFDQFNAKLRAEAEKAEASTASWLREHGYVEQPDGSWRQP